MDAVKAKKTLQAQCQEHIESMIAPGKNPEARQAASVPLIEILGGADEALQRQAQRIDELSRRVDELTRKASEPSPELLAAQRDLEQLRESSRVAIESKDEQIRELTARLEALPKGVDESADSIPALKEKIRELTEGRAQLVHDHEVAIRDLQAKVEAAGPAVQRAEGAERELAELKRTSEANEKRLTEELERLKAQLRDAPEKVDTSGLERRIEELTQNLERVATENAEEIRTREEELAALRPHVEDLTQRLKEAEEGLRGEATKTAAVETKLKISMSVNAMPLEKVLERLVELAEPEADTPEAFEKGLLLQRRDSMLAVRDAITRELEEADAKRRAEVEGRRTIEDAHLRFDASLRQMDQDTALLQTPIENIGKEIVAAREALAAAEDTLGKIASKAIEDADGMIGLKATRAKAHADKKIAMLTVLGRFHETSKAMLLDGLGREIDALGKTLEQEERRLRELENPVGEDAVKDDSAIAEQTKKIELMRAKLEGLLALQKDQGESIVTDVLAKAAHIDALISLLPGDLPAQQRQAYIQKAVEAIVAIQVPLKAFYRDERASHNGIGKLLQDVWRWKEEHRERLDAAVRESGVEGKDIHEKRAALEARVKTLKTWADESDRIFREFRGVGREGADDAVRIWRDEQVECLRLLTTTPFDQLERVLGEQRGLLSQAEVRLEALPKDGEPGYDLAKTRTEERTIAFMQERVRLFELLTTTFVAKRGEFEWEKGVLGTMQRMIFALWAMIWSVPRGLYSGVKNAGKFSPV